MPHRVAPPPLRRVGLLDLLDLVAAQRLDAVRHRLAVSAVAVVEFRGLAVVRPRRELGARLVSGLIILLPALAGGSRDIRFRNFRGDHRFLGGAQRDRRRLAIPCDPLARPIVPYPGLASGL